MPDTMNARLRCVLAGLATALATIACGGSDDDSEAESPEVEPSVKAASARPAAVESLPEPAAATNASASRASGSSQQDSDDQLVTLRVRQALLAGAEARKTQLGVSTRDGIVTLAGTVGAQAYADRAVKIARSTAGVRDVRSDIVVSLHVPTRQR